jgi:hypothetical protein
VNLISFKYFRPKIRMPLKLAPRLVELAIGGYYCDYILRLYSSKFLQALKISVSNIYTYIA